MLGMLVVHVHWEKSAVVDVRCYGNEISISRLASGAGDLTRHDKLDSLPQLLLPKSVLEGHSHLQFHPVDSEDCLI